MNPVNVKLPKEYLEQEEKKYQCCWSYLTFTIENGVKLIQCQSFNTKKDKDNVNLRYFCELHMKEVISARAKMHINCINKVKILDFFCFPNEKLLRNISKRDLINFVNKLEKGDFK